MLTGKQPYFRFDIVDFDSEFKLNFVVEAQYER